MKIDLKQEEFLQRLDLRIDALCAVINHCEKCIGRLIGMKPETQKEWDKRIDKFHLDLVDDIKKIDNKITEHFNELKKLEKGEANG